MPSVVDICNMALTHVGADSQVTSISPPDGSVEAGYCARFYPIARKFLLDEFTFSFAKHRVALAPVDNPSSIWSYAYALPADCTQPLRVLQLNYLAGVSDALLGYPLGLTDWRVIDGLYKERGSSDFEVEGGVLLTNEPDAVLLYKRDVTDPTKFTAMFSDALAMLLASYVAPPLIKGVEGARIGASWREQALRAAERAQTSDANASSERADHVPIHIAVRQ